MSSRSPSNSEASASELLRNLEDMFSGAGGSWCSFEGMNE